MNCPKCGSEMVLTIWVESYPFEGYWCNKCKFHELPRGDVMRFFQSMDCGHEEKVGGEKQNE
jgi:Zn ribbon nucleic-acid-binding protein